MKTSQNLQRMTFGRRWVVIVCSLAMAGCAVGGRSFSIDSTSRVPFFGLELKGRKPKADGPAFRSIRLDRKLPIRVTPLGFSLGKSHQSGGSSEIGMKDSVQVASLPITASTARAASVRESKTSRQADLESVDFR